MKKFLKRLVYLVLIIIVGVFGYKQYSQWTANNDLAEQKVTTTSSAYIPLKKRVSELVATMLLRVLKDTTSTKTKNEIISMLKEKNLYPTQFKPDTQEKRWFLYFANNYMLFSIACYLISKLNTLRYGN